MTNRTANLFKQVRHACLALALCAGTAQAQSFEDILGRAQSAVGDIGKYQEALQNPDLRLQYAFVQEMLKLQDPALQRLAKEHALFSSNPVMREAAIKAILDSRAMLRIQIAGTEGTYDNVAKWVTSNGGTFVSNRGELLVRANEPVTDSCWGTDRHCVFRQVGSTVQYNPYYPGNYTNNITAILNLGNDGVLRGTLSHNGAETLQVQVDLKE